MSRAANGGITLLAALALLACLSVTAVEGTAGQAHVRRLAGETRDQTAAAIAGDGWEVSAHAVLGDPYDPMSMLVAGHLASRVGSPLLASRPSAVPGSTEQALADLGVDTVTVVGDVQAPTTVTVTETISGPTPATLAAEALLSVPVAAGQPLVLTRDDTFADALAAANLAPAGVLLTPSDRLSTEVRDLLSDVAPTEVVILGGPLAISEAVADDIRRIGHDVTRLAGADRVATSLLAAERRAGTRVTVVASAWVAADALAAVPWVARADAALLLTDPRELSPPVDQRLREPATAGDGAAARQVVVTGGPAAIGEFVVDGLRAALGGAPLPGFEGLVRVLSDAERQAMTGVTWHEGCPVELDDLRVVQARRVDLGGWIHDDGELIVNQQVADDVLGVLDQAFGARWPIQRMDPARDFGGDDNASMDADNTSAFNCRQVAGTSVWSQHAYGTAIDLNPIENPYVRGGEVLPEAGAAYMDRADVRPGMLVEGDPVLTAFDELGWGWGGRWSSSKDYQHLSLTGR